MLAWFTVQAIHPPEGPHGGAVKPAGDFFIEAGRNDAYIYAYILDSTLSSMSNDGITCAAVFDFPDKTTGNLELVPFGKDGFRAALIDRVYTTCTIVFERNGKKISAEFGNEGMLVINE